MITRKFRILHHRVKFVVILSFILTVWLNSYWPKVNSGSSRHGYFQQLKDRLELSSADQSWKKDDGPWNITADYLEEAGLPFQSPFIYSDSGDSQSIAISGKKPLSSNSKTWTFAIVWPCENSSDGCFKQLWANMSSCRYKNCRQTYNLEEADVVVFNAFRMLRAENVPKFTRPPLQRWVMLTIEAPIRRENFKMLDIPCLQSQFNWTQTYRLDSDILYLYGQLERVKVPTKNYEVIFHQKSATVAWFVSNCQTQSLRHIYVERMQKVMDVHIFGMCGHYNCSRGHNLRKADQDVCFPMLSKTYFFYLAFENSLCKDYVTEKFFKIFEDVDVIPVVRGGTDYKRYFPPNTFIDASEFDSPETLARFLLALASDKVRYISMLTEKHKYRYRKAASWECGVCERLQYELDYKWYPDTREWFVADQCYQPTDV